MFPTIATTASLTPMGRVYRTRKGAENFAERMAGDDLALWFPVRGDDSLEERILVEVFPSRGAQGDGWQAVARAERRAVAA